MPIRRAPYHRESHDSVNTESGEQQPKSAEEAHDARTEPVSLQAFGIVAIHQRNIVDSERFVRLPDGLLDATDHR